MSSGLSISGEYLQLKEDMLATAVKYLSQHLREKHYSKGNEVIPIRRIRQKIVPNLASDYIHRMRQSPFFRRSPKTELKRIVEDAARELGYERTKVRVMSSEPIVLAPSPNLGHVPGEYWVKVPLIAWYSHAV